jgi:hypothetical protein
VTWLPEHREAALLQPFDVHWRHPWRAQERTSGPRQFKHDIVTCWQAQLFGARMAKSMISIAFHEQEHEPADGTRHSHPSCHLDPDHKHNHGEEQ